MNTIQLTIAPKHVKKVPFEKLYTLKSRQTYLGIHREVVRSDMEIGCTRSALVGFVKHRDALRFKDLLTQQQHKKYVLDRHLQGSTLTFVPGDLNTPLRSLTPIEIEPVPRLFILSMCLVYSMDIWTVDDFSKIPTDGYTSSWKMYCYESRLDTTANPEMLAQLL